MRIVYVVKRWWNRWAWLRYRKLSQINWINILFFFITEMVVPDFIVKYALELTTSSSAWIDIHSNEMQLSYVWSIYFKLMRKDYIALDIRFRKKQFILPKLMVKFHWKVYGMCNIAIQIVDIFFSHFHIS